MSVISKELSNLLLGGAKAAKGYLEHTPKKPNPAVGQRFEKTMVGDLAEPKPFDLEKQKGSSIIIKPWDSQSRGYKIESISGNPLVGDHVTEGGFPYALDIMHMANKIGGASNKEIAKRIIKRSDIARMENELAGGSGKVFYSPTTMGYGGEDFSVTPTKILVDLLSQKEFNPTVMKQFDELVKAYNVPGKGRLLENFVGFKDPRFEQQLLEGGFGLNTTPGELRKGIVDRLTTKGSQKSIGFNEEDLRNAIVHEPLYNMPKGITGDTLIEALPGELTASKHSAYSHDYPGLYAGTIGNVPVDILFADKFPQLTKEFTEKYPNKPDVAIRQMVLGALEKRNEDISQLINDRVINNVGYYKEGLEKGLFTPQEIKKAVQYVYGKKEGGLAHLADGGKTPAWQRKEGKNPEGGLNAVGRASYNRETGGNLKRPQPEGGKRRDSFCARMKGMKKKLTSAETANDPDSRINKSLRAWNC